MTLQLLLTQIGEVLWPEFKLIDRICCVDKTMHLWGFGFILMSVVFAGILKWANNVNELQCVSTSSHKTVKLCCLDRLSRCWVCAFQTSCYWEVACKLASGISKILDLNILTIRLIFWRLDTACLCDCTQISWWVGVKRMLHSFNPIHWWPMHRWPFKCHITRIHPHKNFANCTFIHILKS